MRCLIVDDDETCRKFLLKVMGKHAACHIAINGMQALSAITAALRAGELYDVIFLDIMMPELDGKKSLIAIRALEEKAGLMKGWGAKIVMTTAVDDYDNIRHAFHQQCDGYLVKPLSI